MGTSDDLGAIDVQVQLYELPFPAPAPLQPFAGDPGRVDGLTL